MNRTRKVTLAVLLGVLVLSMVGGFTTRGVMETLPFLHGQKAGWNSVIVPHGIVDQRPWKTAEALASFAVSAEEREFAREAERLADHEVDQAFAQSLRQASSASRELSGEALSLQRRVMEQQAVVDADQAHVAFLTAKDASSALPAIAGDDLEVAKAQLGLDRDELEASIEDLARETGDQRGKIQQELSAREAAMKGYDMASAAGDGLPAVVSATRYTTLAGQVASWGALRSRKQLIEQAEQLARADIAALKADHATLAAAIKAADVSAENAKAGGRSGSGRVKDLLYLSSQRNVLRTSDDRLATQQQLATLYVGWGKQVQLQHKIVLHLMLQSLTLIAVLTLLTILAGWGVEIALNRVVRDSRQKQMMRAVLNVGTQVVGLLLVLLVIFGTPQQMPTILGLAAAGLTVVFQDFILAFCGWFALMGPNGIRVGDWVEIDSVGGEVVKLGVFRTWLLESGNWTANGHPTGRRVSFLNGYAIRGRFFNFSTTGQWMWDEIKVSIPPGAEAYPLIEKIRDAVVEATESDAQMAEGEWKRVTREEGLPQFSAKPSVDLRPAGAGVDIVVRYITRARVRLETRNRLYGSVVELMRIAREAGQSSQDQKALKP